MNWRFKAALMDLFSVSPGGDHLHYWTQRNVTKSLPRSQRDCIEKFRHANEHLEALARYNNRPVSELQFYEFGAGWDLTIAFCFHALGITSQILTDVFELARVDLINDAAGKVWRLSGQTDEARTGAQAVPETQEQVWVPFLEKTYGIKYLAPCDARSTGLPAKSVDCITSTDTLEHIPEGDISQILRECRRLIRTGGLLSFVIDYQDHYFYCDGSITPYNFLRYSANHWRWFNPRFHFQNRLRHRDYIRLAEEQGFELLEDKSHPVTSEDLLGLKQLEISSPFRGRYTLEELAVRRGHLVFRAA